MRFFKSFFQGFLKVRWKKRCGTQNEWLQADKKVDNSRLCNVHLVLVDFRTQQNGTQNYYCKEWTGQINMHVIPMIFQKGPNIWTLSKRSTTSPTERKGQRIVKIKGSSREFCNEEKPLRLVDRLLMFSIDRVTSECYLMPELITEGLFLWKS